MPSAAPAPPIDWQKRALEAEAKLEKAKAMLGSIARQIGTLLGSDWLKEPLQDAAPDACTRPCDSCVLGGDLEEKPCEFREDTGLQPSWLCADCYQAWKGQGQP
jgi:hypothetical protein